MPGPNRTPVRVTRILCFQLVLGGCLLALLPGCNDGPVGSAYKAERESWRASRLEQRLALQPGSGPDAVRPAVAAYEQILARYPIAAGGGDAESRKSLSRSRTLAARRLAALCLASGREARAVQVLWGAREDALVDPAAAVGLYADLLQGLARGRSADSLADACRDMYQRLPAVQADGSPVMPVLQAPISRIMAYTTAGRSADAAAASADALAYYQRVAQEHPRTPSEVVVLMQQADVLARTGRISESVAVLQKARSHPAVDGLASRVALMIAQLREREPGGSGPAIQAYRDILRDFPSQQVTMLAGIRLGALLASTGQPDSALAILDRLARDNPRELEGASQARLQRGVILRASGRTAEAIRELRLIATDFPRTRAGLQAPLQVASYYQADHDSLSMQTTLREAARGYEQLIQDLRTDPQQAPLVMAALDRLSEARMGLRDWTALAQLLQDRAAAFPRDSRSPASLADAAQVLEQKLHDREGCLQVLHKLADTYPGHPLAKAAQSKIAQLTGGSGS
jgi:tetratricopeptide (TPR) repeat protein